ncbi:MAG: hypothetical protein U0441_27785 [Polyangiaceae bacterium]
MKDAELPVEDVAHIMAQVDVHKDRPRAEVLAPFQLTEADWDKIMARFNARLVEEIRERSGSSAPLEERYPLTTTYAKAYATAVREAKERADKPEDEATIRLSPDAPRDEPLSLLGASNRAARLR